MTDNNVNQLCAIDSKFCARDFRFPGSRSKAIKRTCDLVLLFEDLS